MTLKNNLDGVDCCLQMIILATGFQVQGFFAPMTITGKRNNHTRGSELLCGGERKDRREIGVDGKEEEPEIEDLNETWQKTSPQSYLGIAFAGVPNSFAILGPGTGSIV